MQLRADARLRRRLLEGFPGRGEEPDAAPAADRPARDAPVRRLVDLRARAALAGAADDRPDDADRSRPTTASRRSARATPRPGAAASTSRFETEFNRFANPDDQLPRRRQTGVRMHAIGSIARPFFSPGWTVTPRVSFNAASYSLDLPLADGSRSASRVIPTVSVDSAWTLERETSFFGRTVRQTLEPRLFYVDTPYRGQNELPNFDSALKDFNFDSIFTENAFSGVDRVSDSNQLTAGVDLAHPRSRQRRRGAARRPRAALSLPRPAHHARRRAADAALLRRARLRLDQPGAALDLRHRRRSSIPTATASSARSPAFAIRRDRIAPSA